MDANQIRAAAINAAIYSLKREAGGNGSYTSAVDMADIKGRTDEFSYYILHGEWPPS